MANPLGFWLSRGLFLAGRWSLRQAVKLKQRQTARSGPLPAWQGYGEILQQQPLFFHYIMFQAPRWNCHAVIGVLNGLRIQRQLHLHLTTANQAAAAWTIVVYAQNPNPHTIATIEPGQETADGWLHLDLPPGHYHLGARYYGWREHAHWPEVRTDDTGTIPARAIGEEPRRYTHYLQTLQGQPSWFYSAVHHHLFAALTHHPTAPAVLDRWVLPVGNPATVFHYGILPANNALQIRQEPTEPATALVFLTLLNRASLPLYWCEVQTPLFQSPVVTEPALYLVRIQTLAGHCANPPVLRLSFWNKTGIDCSTANQCQF